MPNLDRPRLEVAVREGDDRIALGAAVDDRLLRDRQLASAGRTDDDGHVRLGLELEAGVRELRADLHAPRLRVDLGRDVRDRSFQCARGLTVGELDFGLLAHPEERKLVLEDRSERPNAREVRDLEGRHLRRDVLAGEGVALQDDSVEGRVEHHGLANFSRLLQLGDVLLGDVPELQAVARRRQQRLRRRARRGHLARAELRARLQGQKVLLLGGDKLRAVDAEKGLAPPDRLADVVDEHLLDPAGDLGVDLGHARLVVGERPDGANRRVELTMADDRRSDADQLLPRRGDIDGLVAGPRRRLHLLIRAHPGHPGHFRGAAFLRGNLRRRRRPRAPE